MVSAMEAAERKMRIERMAFGSSNAEASRSPPTSRSPAKKRSVPMPPTSRRSPSAARPAKPETAKSRRRVEWGMRSASLPPVERSRNVAKLKDDLEADRAQLKISTEKRKSASDKLGTIEPLVSSSEKSHSHFSGASSGTSVVLLGASRSGKTLVAQTFCAGVAQIRPAHTVGVERFDVRSSSCGELRVWDTSGDGRFDEVALGLVRTASALMILYAVHDEESLEQATLRMARAKCDALETAALALVGTTISHLDDPAALLATSAIVQRAVRAAEASNVMHCLVVANDRTQVDALFGDVCEKARMKRLETEQAAIALRQKESDAVADAADAAADLELCCYFLALLFLILGMPLAA